MAVTGWILVQTEVGKARVVADTVAALQRPGVRVMASDTVTGPHDVIVHLEAPDLDALNRAVEEALQKVPGVEHTITCVTMFHGSSG